MTHWEMAAIFNRTDFLHLSSDEMTNEILNYHQKKFVTFSWIQGFIVCLINPLTIFSNPFVVYVVWKDAMKNLRCSPSNFILQSMATVDLLVGLILSPIQASWLFSNSSGTKTRLFAPCDLLHLIYSCRCIFHTRCFAFA